MSARTAAVAEAERMPVWQQEFAGRYWWEMPGLDSEVKKLNFFLFRRGLLEVEEVELDSGEVRTALVTKHWTSPNGMPPKGFAGPNRQRMLEAMKRRLTGPAETRIKEPRALAPKPLPSETRQREQERRREQQARRKANRPPEQLALVARYAELSAKCERMDKPLQRLRAWGRERGFTSTRVEHLLTSGHATLKPGEHPEMVALLDKLEAWIQWRDELREEVRALLTQVRTHGAYGVEFMRRAQVSYQAVVHLRQGKLGLTAERLMKVRDVLRQMVEGRAAA